MVYTTHLWWLGNGLLLLYQHLLYSYHIHEQTGWITYQLTQLHLYQTIRCDFKLGILTYDSCARQPMLIHELTIQETNMFMSIDFFDMSIRNNISSSLLQDTRKSNHTCIYPYIYIYIHMYICVHICIHTYIHAIENSRIMYNDPHRRYTYVYNTSYH